MATQAAAPLSSLLANGRRRPAATVPIVPVIPLPFIQKRHIPAVAENNVAEGSESTINGFASNGDEQLAASLMNGTARKTPSADDDVATEPLRVETNGISDKPTGQPVNGSNSSPDMTPVLSANQTPIEEDISSHDVRSPSASNSSSEPQSTMSGQSQSPRVQYAHNQAQRLPPMHTGIIFGSYVGPASHPHTSYHPLPTGGQRQPPPGPIPVGAVPLEFRRETAPPPAVGPDFAHRRPPYHIPAVDLTQALGHPYIPFPQPWDFRYPHPRERVVSFAPSDGWSPVGTPRNGEGSHTPSVAGSGVRMPRDGSLRGSVASEPAPGNEFLAELPATGPALEPHCHRQPTVDVGIDNAGSLFSHLLTHFDDQLVTDCAVEVRHSEGRFPPASIPAHRILLTRSEYFRTQLARSEVSSRSPAATAAGSSTATRAISIETSDRFISVDAVRQCVRCLYGAPWQELFPPRQLRAQLTHLPNDEAVKALDAVLGLAAAANVLQMGHIVVDGADTAVHLVRWQTLEKLLAFALEGGLGDEWTPADEGREEATAANGNTANEASHLSAAIGRAEAPAQRRTHGPLYGAAVASRLIDTAGSFIVAHCPPHFVFDPTAPELSMVPRLPDVGAAQPSTAATEDAASPIVTSRPELQRPAQAHPRLALLRFGDHLSEHRQRERETHNTAITRMISSVLLSLPFPLLQNMLGTAGLWFVLSEAAREKLAFAVVSEREKRREQAIAVLSSKLSPSSPSASPAADSSGVERSDHDAPAPTTLPGIEGDVDAPVTSTQCSVPPLSAAELERYAEALGWKEEVIHTGHGRDAHDDRASSADTVLTAKKATAEGQDKDDPTEGEHTADTTTTRSTDTVLGQTIWLKRSWVGLPW